MDSNKFANFIPRSEAKSKAEELLSTFATPIRLGLAYWNLENKQHLDISEVMDTIVQELGDKGYELIVHTCNSFARTNRLKRLENTPEEAFFASYVEIPQALIYLAEQIKKTRKLENTINMLAQADMEKP